MSSTLPSMETPSPSEAVPTLAERTLRIFVRPSTAWTGLETRAQWWFPLLIFVAANVALMGLTFHRVLLPTMLEQWNQAIENGQMTAAQVEKISSFFADSPAGLGMILGQQLVFIVLVTMLTALVVWFGLGFVLGTKLSFRLALEVVSWASLVRLPEVVLTYAIGWWQETLKGIHFGLAILMPEADPPSKVHMGLSVLLDAVGPFVAWYLFVAVLGASALSGAPRRNVAWVLAVLYLALMVVFATLTWAVSPGA